MKRMLRFLLLGAVVLGLSGCSYQVTWGKHGVKLTVTPDKKARAAKPSSPKPNSGKQSSAKASSQTPTKQYTKAELDQLTAELLAPYEQRGYTKEKGFTGTKKQYAKWENDPSSPPAKYAAEEISVEQAKGTGDQFVYFCPAKQVAWAVILTADK